MADDEKGEKIEEKEELEEKVSDEDLIKLTPEQYSGLLDRLADLEARSSTPRRLKAEPANVDDLVSELDDDEEEEEEGRPAPRKAPVLSQEQVDNMTNTQLVQFLSQNLDGYMSKAMMPVLTRLEKIKVNDEIRQCRADYEDFDDHYEQIGRIAQAKPDLSIDEAYHIAKGKSARSKAQGNAPEKKGRYMSLPPRPVFGERPGASRKTTIETPKTREEAIERAYEETFSKKKK